MRVGLIMKKATALFLSVLTVLSISFTFAFSSFAEDEKSAPMLYTRKYSTQLFSIGKKIVDRFSTDNLETYSNDIEITFESFEGAGGIIISPKEDDASWPVSVFKRHDEVIDLSSYKELFFLLLFQTDVIGKLDVSITLKTYKGNYTVSGEISSGDKYEVYVPLSDFEGLDSVYETVLEFSSDIPVSSVKFSSLFADSNYSYEHIERFSAEKFTSEIGIEVFEKEIMLEVKDGNAELKASTVTAETEQGNTITALVSVSGVKSGTMTLSVKNVSKNEENDISTVTLFEGQNSYAFMFPESKGTDSYSLTFSGIKTENDSRLTLHSVGFSYFSETLSEEKDVPGAVSSCTLNADSSEVHISGTLRSGTAASNIDAGLGIVAEDIWKTDVTEVLVEGDMTTVFNFSVPTDRLKMNPAFYRFYLVLIDGDEVKKLSNAAYPAVASANVTSGKTVFGLQSTDNSTPFSSNASHTVVDVFLDRLENADSTSGRLHSYAGGYKYISNSYVNELDSKINFSLKAGTPVYLRILEKENPENGNSISYAYSFDASDYALSVRYMTLIDFLSSRYEGVAGYIVGTRADSRDCNYCDKESLISYARNYAQILRMTSVVVRNNVSDAFISVSVGDGYVYSRENKTTRNLSYNEFTGVGEYSFDPILFCNVLSHTISETGSFGWYLTYECESEPASAIDSAYRIYASLLQGSGTAPSGHMLFWQPEKQLDPLSVEEILLSLFEKCSSYNTRAAILSLTKQSEGIDETVSVISSMSLGEGADRQFITGSCSLLSAPNVGEALFLWDFRKSFSTEGFVSAGNIISLTTESSPSLALTEGVADCRALRGTISAENGKDGVILCYFDSPIDASKIDKIDLTIFLESENADYIPVTVILGSGNKRCEYSADVPTHSPSTLSCDTSAIPKNESVSYIAVSFETEEDARFDISSISAMSDGKTSEEIANSIGLVDGDEKDKTSTADALIVIGAAAFVTAIIFAGLSLRQDSFKSKKASDNQNNK